MAVQKEFRIPGALVVTGTANVGSLTVTSGDLAITGGITTTANVTVGGASLTIKSAIANGTVNITTGASNNTPSLSVTAGLGTVSIVPGSLVGSYNPIILANDVVLYAHGGSIDTGNLVIGTWSTRAAGLGIRIRSALQDIQISANTITLGNSAFSVNGSIGVNGQVLYSNGSSPYWGTQVTGGVTSVATANGLSGGTITTTGTLFVVGANGTSVTATGINVLAGNNQLIANTTGIFLDQTKVDHNLLANYNANQHFDHTAISVSPGNGLVGGGTIAATRTLAVSAGNNQVVANTTGVFIDQTKVDHNLLANYNANQHFDHTAISVLAGTGMTGGGTIAATRTLTLDTAYVSGLTVNNALYLGGQPNSYYTDITSRLGYTPVRQGGGTLQGANTVYVGWGTTGDGIKLQVDAVSYGNVWPMSITGVAGAVANNLIAGTGISGSNYNGNVAVTWTLASAFGDTTNPYASKTANFVLAAPNGAAGAPTFRAIVAADIPTLNQTTTGAAGSVTGITLQAGLGTTSVPTFANVIVTSTANCVMFNASGNTQISSLGVGTTASGTAGAIRATNDITAYFSDSRLKVIHGQIGSALDKVNSLSGVYFNANETAAQYGYDISKRQVGVIAQEVYAALPEVIDLAPFDTTVVNGIMQSISGENYLTVHYEKLVPLLIEAIKELSAQVDQLRATR